MTISEEHNETVELVKKCFPISSKAEEILNLVIEYEKQSVENLGITEKFKKDLLELAAAFHLEADDHDPENFRGCTHIVCKTIKKAIRVL